MEIISTASVVTGIEWNEMWKRLAYMSSTSLKKCCCCYLLFFSGNVTDNLFRCLQSWSFHFFWYSFSSLNNFWLQTQVLRQQNKICSIFTVSFSFFFICLFYFKNLIAYLFMCKSCKKHLLSGSEQWGSHWLVHDGRETASLKVPRSLQT